MILEAMASRIAREIRFRQRRLLNRVSSRQLAHVNHPLQTRNGDRI